MPARATSGDEASSCSVASLTEEGDDQDTTHSSQNNLMPRCSRRNPSFVRVSASWERRENVKTSAARAFSPYALEKQKEAAALEKGKRLRAAAEASKKKKSFYGR